MSLGPVRVRAVTAQQAALPALHAEGITVMGKMCKCGYMIKEHHDIQDDYRDTNSLQK